jgi:hypothetical protein
VRVHALDLGFQKQDGKSANTYEYNYRLEKYC